MHQNKAYTFTGPESLDYVDIANMLTLLTGRRITYDNPSLFCYRSRYVNERGLDPAYVNVTMALYFMTRLGTSKTVTDDFERLTGEPQRMFAAFAKEHIQTFER